MLKEAATYLKDCLFPFFCAGCGKEGEWWCENCRKDKKNSPIIFGAGELKKVTALFRYSGNIAIEKLIKDFKYNYTLDLCELWKEILIEAEFSLAPGTVLVPVPLHPRRFRERGFNQAEKLVNILAAVHQAPAVVDGLVRIRMTTKQAGLHRELRLKNVKEAFAWKSAVAPPRRVLLVDDVYTTGATMQECARVLKANGCVEVEGLVLAHG